MLQTQDRVNFETTAASFIIALVLVDAARDAFEDARDAVREKRNARRRSKRQLRKLNTDLEKLKSQKHQFEKEIEATKALLDALRPLDEITKDIYDTCQIIEDLEKRQKWLSEESLRLQLLIPMLRIEAFGDPSADPVTWGLSGKLHEACVYFEKNVSPHASRYTEAIHRIGKLWGV